MGGGGEEKLGKLNKTYTETMDLSFKPRRTKQRPPKETRRTWYSVHYKFALPSIQNQMLYAVIKCQTFITHS